MLHPKEIVGDAADDAPRVDWDAERPPVHVLAPKSVDVPRNAPPVALVGESLRSPVEVRHGKRLTAPVVRNRHRARRTAGAWHCEGAGASKRVVPELDRGKPRFLDANHVSRSVPRKVHTSAVGVDHGHRALIGVKGDARDVPRVGYACAVDDVFVSVRRPFADSATGRGDAARDSTPVVP